MSISKQYENDLKALILDYFRQNYTISYNPQIHKLVIKYIVKSFGTKAYILEEKIFETGLKHLKLVTVLDVRNFARETLKIFTDFGFSKDQSEDEKKPDIKKITQGHLKKSLKEGLDQNEAILKASKKLFILKKKDDQIEKRHFLIEKHPLRENLLSMKLSKKNIPRQDIRNHLLHLNTKSSSGISGEGMLYSILTKARSFSIFHLHALLGDELFFLLKPLGFLDKNDCILQAEVATSSHLAIAHFRKLEILKLLKKDSVFKSVKEIKFICRGGSP